MQIQRDSEIIQQINRHRRDRGFLTVQELLQNHGHNTILDPFSTLISATVEIGTGNIFYPGVIIEAVQEGTIRIGDNNVFHTNTLLLADKGRIVIGSHNQFGDGGASIKANMSGADIRVGDFGRYINGPQMIGHTILGAGSQVIGPITVQNCVLEAGASYQDEDPDARGGVLKGAGLARNINVRQGEVLNGQGTFEQSRIERQSFYHPKK